VQRWPSIPALAVSRRGPVIEEEDEAATGARSERSFHPLEGLFGMAG
jgi:hypothetical protein